MILDDKNFIFGVILGVSSCFLAEMLFDHVIEPLVDKVKAKALSKRNSDTKPE